MKKILLLAIASLFVAHFGLGQIVGENMIENFENTRRINYGYISGAFSQPIGNPYLGLGNTSSQVGQYVRSAGTQYDVIVCNLVGNAVGINDYIAGTKKFSMKVYTTAPVGTSVELTMQNAAIASGPYPVGRHSVYSATTTIRNGWQTLTFTFSNQPTTNTPAAQLDQMVISFNNNSFTGDTYTWDDLAGVALNNVTAPTTNDFLWANFGTINHLAFNRADGAWSKVLNPDRAGNPSDSVARYVRSGVQYDVLALRWDAQLRNLADYRANTKKFSLKVWSPAAGTTIQFTLQDSLAARGGYPAGRSSEFTGVTTTTNQWEKVVLTWVNTPDASVTDANVNELAILYNSNTFAPITVYMDSLYGPQFTPVINSLDQVTAKTTVKAYPQPTNNVLNLVAANNEAITALMVRDMTGRAVITQEMPNNQNAVLTLNVAELPAGVYQLSTKTRTGYANQPFVVKK